MREEDLLGGVEVGDDVFGEDQVDLVVSDEGGVRVLGGEEGYEDVGVADGEGIEQTHGFIDEDVGEHLGVGVEVRPLQDALHEDITLHLVEALAGVLLGGDGEAGVGGGTGG